MWSDVDFTAIGRETQAICSTLYWILLARNMSTPAWNSKHRRWNVDRSCLSGSALEDLLAMEPKTEPDLRFLSIIRIANSIVHSIQHYFQTSVVNGSQRLDFSLNRSH